ncbi:MAG: basic amino acid ABC transporter substrate-binding protein [Actinomycetota bacterium]
MFERRRYVIKLLAVLAAVMLVAAACGEEEPEDTGGLGDTETEAPAVTTLTEGTLLVGSCLDFRPFEYREGGELKGFDVDLVGAIAERLGLEVEFKKANFDTIFTAVAAGQFDIVAAASTITEERDQVVDFSDPYYAARQGFAVNTEETPDVDSLDDLGEGDVIGVQKGTTGKAYAEENAPEGVEIKTFQVISQAFTDLEGGRVTAIVNDEPSSVAEVEQRPGLEVTEAFDTGENYGFAFSEENQELIEAVNQTLADLIADGTYAEIFETYFPGTPVPEQFQA